MSPRRSFGRDAERFIRWVGVRRGKLFDWEQRCGRANEHKGKVPREHWLEKWEQQAILAHHRANPLEGYRRGAFMMLGEDVVAVTPASVYSVLSAAGLLAATRSHRRRAPASSSRCMRMNIGTVTWPI